MQGCQSLPVSGPTEKVHTSTEDDASRVMKPLRRIGPRSSFLQDFPISGSYPPRPMLRSATIGTAMREPTLQGQRHHVSLGRVCTQLRDRRTGATNHGPISKKWIGLHLGNYARRAFRYPTPEGIRVRRDEGRTNEAKAVHGRADHRGFEGARGRAKAADLARKQGISEATFYNWKAKFGGMDVSEAKRLSRTRMPS